MRAHIIRMTAKLGVALTGAAIMAVAWSLYRDPAMSVMLDAVRFCG